MEFLLRDIKKMLAISIFFVIGLQSNYAFGGYVSVQPNKLKFTDSGEKPVTVFNGLDKDIVLENILFDKEDASFLPVLKSIFARGFEACSNIPAEKSCQFFIGADKNAGALNNLQGTKLSFDYKIAGEKKVRSPISFDVLIDYNKDLKFDYEVLEANSKLKLKIENINPDFPITVTKAIFPLESDHVTSVSLKKQCSEVVTDGYCEVMIDSFKDLKGDFLLPYIKYNVGKENGVLVAINEKESGDFIDMAKALLSGLGFGGVILYTYGNNNLGDLVDDCVKLNFKQRPIDQLTQGLVSGAGYQIVDEIAGGYSANSVTSSMIALALTLTLGYKECSSRSLNGKGNFIICMIMMFGCNAMSSVSWDAMVNNWFSDSQIVNNLPAGFAGKAVFRVFLKNNAGFINDGLSEIVADTFSGFAMYTISHFKFLFEGVSEKRQVKDKECLDEGCISLDNVSYGDKFILFK